jgi:hypothetical protein
MLASITRVQKHRAIAALAVAAIAAGTVGVTVGQAAGQASQPAGQFSFAGQLLVGCPTGAVLCTKTRFTGGLAGTGEFTLLSLVPSPTPNVYYFNGQMTLNTLLGELKCGLNGALNNDPKSQGEFGEICVINGGTGVYKGAKGHLRLFGTSTTSSVVVPSGGGDYKASISTTTP